MGGLEELIEGLADEGVRDSTGGFTLAANQIWQGLNRSIGEPGNLPRFLLRWLLSQVQQPSCLAVETKGRNVCFRAFKLKNADLDSFPCPTLDYSGEDIELARGLICAQLLKADGVHLKIAGSKEAWRADYQGSSPASWSRESWNGEPEIQVSLTLPKREEKKICREWKKLLTHHFRLCPVPLTWNEEPLGKLFAFTGSPLVWRRLLPKERSRPLLPFRPPDSSTQNFVCSRYENIEVLMSLGTGTESKVQLLHKGDVFQLSKPGFLPGYEILVNMPGASLDMQGLSVVTNQTLLAVLDQLKEEAYDMALQAYRLEEPPDSSVLVKHLVAFEGVLLFLLDQQRWVEGYFLTIWLDRGIGDALPQRSARENYTFYKTAAMLSEKANHPVTAQRFEAKAKAITQNARSEELNLEAALIDAYLDSKARKGEADLLHYHTRSRIHLLAVRYKNAGREQSALRLFYVLTTSFANLDAEHLELWFETAELAQQLKKFDILKKLLLFLNRSEESGKLALNSRLRQRAKSYFDAVKANT